MAFKQGTNQSDTLSGTPEKDTILAGAGDDFVFGRNGNDYIKGEQGQDTIDGGGGRDRLWGGSGRDVFVFNDGDSTEKRSDYILDFEQGQDLIDLSGLGDVSFRDLEFSYSTKANGQVVTTIEGPGDFVLRLKGDYDLSRSDFDF